MIDYLICPINRAKDNILLLFILRKLASRIEKQIIPWKRD